jgi:hypothetical protein
MWQSTGMKTKGLLLVGGQAVINQIAENFQFFLPSSGSTQTTSRVTQRNQGDSTLGSNISTYTSTWGTLELIPTKWNAFPGFGGNASTTVPDWRAYLLHADMWEWDWNQKPTVYQPEYQGGSYRSAIEAILMLLCKNPIAEGKIAPSDA